MQRRKIGGRAGKKKWKRQSDTTLLQLHDLRQAKKTVADSRPKSATPLFKIQVEPDVAAKKKLDKDRFKEKLLPITSKAELKRLKKLEKKEGKQEGESTEAESKVSKPAPRVANKEAQKDADIEAEFDIWAADLKELNIHYDKPQIKTKKEIEVPKTVAPYAGQSYNPSHLDQLELMKVIVDKAEEKKPVFKTKSEKAQERALKESLKKRPPQKPRSKKEKEILEAQERQREEKQKAYDAKNIERYFNEARNKQRKHGSRESARTPAGTAQREAGADPRGHQEGPHPADAAHDRPQAIRRAPARVQRGRLRHAGRPQRRGVAGAAQVGYFDAGRCTTASSGRATLSLTAGRWRTGERTCRRSSGTTTTTKASPARTARTRSSTSA